MHALSQRGLRLNRITGQASRRAGQAGNEAAQRLIGGTGRWEATGRVRSPERRSILIRTPA